MEYESFNPTVFRINPFVISLQCIPKLTIFMCILFHIYMLGNIIFAAYNISFNIINYYHKGSDTLVYNIYGA